MLFGPDRDLSNGLDRLVRVAGRVRDAERGRNWSNTAAVALAGGGALTAFGDVADGDIGGLAKTLGLTLVAPHVAARLLTNPTVVRWMAAEAPRAVNGALPESSIAALGRVGAITPQIRDEAEQLRLALRPAPARAPSAPPR